MAKSPILQHTAAQWASGFLPGPFGRTVLTTSDSVEAELIRYFQLYSEAKTVGRGLLTKHGHPRNAKNYVRLQAYIRQFIAFYGAAGHLNYRAAPLLYYYSFLNLAKAIAFVRDPAFPAGRIKHGLGQGPVAASLVKSTVISEADGVFNRFFKLIFGQEFPKNSSVDIRELLGYMTDLRWEYGSFNLGAPRSTSASISVTRDARETDFRGLLTVKNIGSGFDRSVAKVLVQNFEQVLPDQQTIRNIFGWSPARTSEHTFWRTRKAYSPTAPGKIAAHTVCLDIAASLGNKVSKSPFDEDELIAINLDLKQPPGIPMNEFMAIYVVMFFLGSLVRYRPEILEGMLINKDAWLVEVFVRSTPVTFLRHARNFLDDNFVAYKAR